MRSVKNNAAIRSFHEHLEIITRDNSKLLTFFHYSIELPFQAFNYFRNCGITFINHEKDTKLFPNKFASFEGYLVQKSNCLVADGQDLCSLSGVKNQYHVWYGENVFFQ